MIKNWAVTLGTTSDNSPLLCKGRDREDLICWMSVLSNLPSAKRIRLGGKSPLKKGDFQCTERLATYIILKLLILPFMTVLDNLKGS
jgi:hypothetical protein